MATIPVVSAMRVGIQECRVPEFSIHLNGQLTRVTADGDTPLLWVLRDSLNLVGTKFGCGGGFCGACTVHLDGVARRACITPMREVGTTRVTTIEGLAPGGDHPVQQAWEELDVAQCGYCQAGQIMTAAALLVRTPNPTDEEIGVAMNGNICRCGTYLRIREAVRHAASVVTAKTANDRQNPPSSEGKGDSPLFPGRLSFASGSTQNQRGER